MISLLFRDVDKFFILHVRILVEILCLCVIFSSIYHTMVNTIFIWMLFVCTYVSLRGIYGFMFYSQKRRVKKEYFYLDGIYVQEYF